MKNPKKITASAVTLLTFFVFVMPAPVVRAENYEYCHFGAEGFSGCVFTNWEQCLAAASGRPGTCRHNAFYYKNPENALAYQPTTPPSRVESHPKKEAPGQ